MVRVAQLKKNAIKKTRNSLSESRSSQEDSQVDSQVDCQVDSLKVVDCREAGVSFLNRVSSRGIFQEHIDQDHSPDHSTN